MTHKEKILVWLPSPMGDTILATAALRALRHHFAHARITYYASQVIRHLLTPCTWQDNWLDQVSPMKAVMLFKQQGFTQVILFKNSFGSAMTCFLAGIPVRIGYARDHRAWLLTKKLTPKRLQDGTFEPNSMVTYYLDLISLMGVPYQDNMPELDVSPGDKEVVTDRFLCLKETSGPLIIFVPGGAFGPSKCWPASHYAQLADKLYDSHQARIVVSVSPNELERKISRTIADRSTCPVTDLGQTPLSMGQLKALFALADLVVSNDTGPRHIAIALKRRVITLFGPNDPKWTQTGYALETQIMASGDCLCCQKPVCRQPDRHCMNTITPETVHRAAIESLATPCS